ncbi:MAG: sodium:calcium antiporter [Actinomycetota bacterium]
MTVAIWLLVAFVGVATIVWGAETFAEHLATAVTASLRNAPAIAIGDVIGANVAICCVALGAAALVAPIPFGRAVRRYAGAGVPAGLLAAAFAWDGTVSRVEGAVLVAAYGAFVGTIWALERRPPTLGETGELDEVRADGRVGTELALVIAGVTAMAIGSVALVEGVRRVSGIEATQGRLGLVVVGLATSFELVVLARSSARRGITTAVVAAVVGSFTYNVTMTLGAGALARPLRLADPSLLRGPWVAMLLALVLTLALSARSHELGRRSGLALLAGYPVFVAFVLTSTRT